MTAEVELEVDMVTCEGRYVSLGTILRTELKEAYLQLGGRNFFNFTHEP